MFMIKGFVIIKTLFCLQKYAVNPINTSGTIQNSKQLTK